MWPGEPGCHSTEDYRPGLLEREARMGWVSQPGFPNACRRSVENILWWKTSKSQPMVGNQTL